MGLVKITFDGSSVSAKQDADINFHLGGMVPAGIVRGLGNELQISSSNNYIKFKSGYVQIYGRRIYVEEGSQVYVSLDSAKYGYVVITVNLVNNTALLTIIEGTSLPTLTQQNLQSGGTIYQMPIAKYSKITTSLTIDTSFQRTFIESALAIGTEALTKVNSLSLKTKDLWKNTYTDDYTPLSKITMDLSSFPYNSILLFTFTTSDPFGYGSLSTVWHHCT